VVLLANQLSVIALIMLVVNIFTVLFASSLGVTNIGDLFLNSVFDQESISSSNPDLNPELDKGIQKELNPDAETTEIGFLEGLKLVFGFIITLLGLGFAFINMLIQTGAPITIILVLGLPVTLGYHFGIVSAIRGFSI